MSTTVLTEEKVLEALYQVIDPEIGCNIVDLGLVYDVTIAGDTVTVRMTLTTPGCPMSETMVWGVKQALLNLPSVMNAEVELVWNPPWNPAMMSDIGRAAVGIRDY
jgi:metal-sulfur cluster biosynthetic enzyme